MVAVEGEMSVNVMPRCQRLVAKSPPMRRFTLGLSEPTSALGMTAVCGEALLAIPVSTGISGLGTGVATALGNATKAASGLVGFSGALGTVVALYGDRVLLFTCDAPFCGDIFSGDAHVNGVKGVM